MLRRTGTRFGSAVAVSLALHATAAAGLAVVLTWRMLPAAPGAEPALEVVWLTPPDSPAAEAEAPPPAAEADAGIREVAPLGPSTTEGMEPEDALATMVALPDPPPAPTAPLTALPPLPIPEQEPPPPPDDPTSLFAQPVQVAALPAPPPSAEALPLPPPLPGTPPPRRVAAPARAPSPPAAAQPVAQAAPAPAPAAGPAAIPVLSGAPRFRRTPAPPDYPVRAREAGSEGTALLRIRVAADGTTQEVRLLRSAGHRLLDEAAQVAARRWEIAPATQNGRPIEAWVEVPVRFRLDD